MFYSASKVSTLGALTFALLASTSVAHALEGKALFEKLMTMAPGTSVTFDSVTEETSDSFVMQGVTMTKDGEPRITIGAVSARGLKETEDGRIVYDAIAISDFTGQGRKPGKGVLKGLASTNGDIPFEALKSGNQEEIKKHRIKLGNFTINGFSMTELPDTLNFNLDAFSVVNADIPLDFRWGGETSDAPVAAPLSIQTIGMTGLTGSQGPFKWNMDAFTLADVNFPTAPQALAFNMLKIYSAMSLNGVGVSMGGTEVLKIDNLGGTITEADGGETLTSTSSMNGLMVNLKAIPEPQAQQIAQQLGYDKIEGSMTGTGSYNLPTGTAKVSDLTLNLKDMFNLSMNYGVTGYTMEVMQKVQEAQAKIAQGTPQMQAFGEIMPILSQIKLEGLSLKLTDQSLTGRLLDFQGKQMGTTGEQLAAGAPMMMGMGMAQLGMPAFTDMVTQAVGKFLKDKGSLSLTAQPGQPVALTDIFTATQTDPKKIPELLNVKVSSQ